MCFIRERGNMRVKKKKNIVLSFFFDLFFYYCIERCVGFIGGFVFLWRKRFYSFVFLFINMSIDLLGFLV